MLNWKSVDIIFLYDGSLDGLFSLIFFAYEHKIHPQKIITKEAYIPNLLDTCQEIPTDFEKSSRIFHGILNTISYSCFFSFYLAFLSSFPKKEMLIFDYICFGFKVGPKIDTMLSIPFVLEIQKIRKTVLGEIHRLSGLLRFMEIGKNQYIATLHPDHNILEPLGKRFIRRFPTMDFVIVDKNRDIGFFYQNTSYFIHSLKGISLPHITEEEKEYQKLWKTFFETIAIKERTNAKLQKQYMPKRYWKDLVEINPVE